MISCTADKRLYETLIRVQGLVVASEKTSLPNRCVYCSVKIVSFKVGANLSRTMNKQGTGGSEKVPGDLEVILHILNWYPDPGTE